MLRSRMLAAVLAAALPAAFSIAAADDAEGCDNPSELETVTADGFEGEMELPATPGLGEGLSDPTTKQLLVDVPDGATATVTVDWEADYQDYDLTVTNEAGDEASGGKFNFVGGEQAGEPTDPVLGIQWGASYEEASLEVTGCDVLTVQVDNYDAFDGGGTAALTVTLE